MKSQKGITLVSLVITIVIMLILAGVSISLVIGQKGIFKKSKNAVAQYKQSAADENSQLDAIETELNSIAIDNGLTLGE